MYKPLALLVIKTFEDVLSMDVGSNILTLAEFANTVNMEKPVFKKQLIKASGIAPERFKAAKVLYKEFRTVL